MGFFEDTFTEAATDTELTAHTPTVGTSWSRIHSDGANPRISAIAATDRLKVSTGGNDSGVVYTGNATAPSANYEAQFDYVAGSAFATRPFFWAVRCADVENMYALRMTNVATGHQLYKKVAGTWTALGSPVTIAVGSVVVIGANGTTIYVKDDGATVISVTDSSLSAAGKVACAVGGGSELVTSTDDANGSWEFDNLVVTDLGGGPTLLTVANADHTHDSEAPALTQAQVLTAADADHGHTGEAVSLLQAHFLAVADADHAHDADGPALVQSHVLSASDADHGHPIDSPSLAQSHLLAVGDADHGHSSDSPSLDMAQALAVQDADHGHDAETVALVQAQVLTAADADHGHTADTPALTQSNFLAVGDADHAHTSETVTLSDTLLLVVQDADHAHTSEVPALLLAYVLAAADANHAHPIDGLALVQAYHLGVADANHAHSADGVILEVAGAYAPAPPSRTSRVRPRGRLTEVGPRSRVTTPSRNSRTTGVED